MAISVDGVSYTGSNAITLNADVPVGVTQSDLLVAWWVVRIANRPTGQMVIPAGWTEIGYQAASGSSPTTKVAVKVWNTGDATRYAFINTGSANHGVSMLRISGINTGTFTTSGRIQFGAHRDATRTTGTVNSLVVSTPDSLLVFGGGLNVNGVTFTPPDGMTEQIDSSALAVGNVTAQEMATQDISASGSTGDKTTTYSPGAQFVGFLWWVEPAPAGGSPQTVTFNTLSLTGSAISLSVVPGTASITFNTLRLTGSAIPLSVVPGEASISFSTLRLTGSAIPLTVVPGAVSIGFSTLGITGSAIPLTVVPGAVSISANTLRITGSAIPLAVSPGAVSIGFNTLRLTGSAIPLSVFSEAFIPFNTLRLTGSAISLTVVPGAVSVAFSTLRITGSAIPLTVTSVAHQTISLDTLNLTGSVIDFTVSSSVSILMDTLGMTGSVIPFTVIPGATSLLLDTLGLIASAVSLSVFVPSAYTSTRRIYHVPEESRILEIFK